MKRLFSLHPMMRVMGMCLLTLSLAACMRTPIQLGNATASSPAVTASLTSERQAVIKEITGEVEVRASSDQPWRTAEVEAALAEGAALRTGAESRAMVQLTEGSKIRLSPGTEFTLKIFNPYLDSLLTSLDLKQGRVWVLLNGGALDVETPLGIASARAAYLSASFNADTQTLTVMCLQGTCSFGNLFVPGGSSLTQTRAKTTGPDLMSMADYGAWCGNVQEANNLCWMSTEEVAQGDATLPVMPTSTLRSTKPGATRTVPARPSATPKPGQPSPTATQPEPTATPILVTSTAVPYTPLPLAPIIGRHVVGKDETLFCLARAYGVLPAAIAQANNLVPPFSLTPGQTLQIPGVQWTNIAAGPVCAPQFTSPYPGLPYVTAVPTLPVTPATSVPPTNPPAETATLAPTVPPTETPVVTATPVPTGAQPLNIVINVTCTANCTNLSADYILHIETQVTGGVAPYTYDPAAAFDSSPFGHCSDASGQITVKDAAGVVTIAPWFYHDSACPTPTLSPVP